MRYTFTGKNMTVTDSIKEQATKKLNRLEKLLPPDAEVHVTFSCEKSVQKVEVTIPMRKRILRAEVAANDMYAAIDEIIDILEKQMVKYKTRLRDRSRKDNAYKEEFNYIPVTEEYTNDSMIQIEKTKRFALKPMDPEEAIMEMELLGHNFFVFRNCLTEDINVVYKRQNGSYGLIEPEY